jgi:hypothetical protein
MILTHIAEKVGQSKRKRKCSSITRKRRIKSTKNWEETKSIIDAIEAKPKRQRVPEVDSIPETSFPSKKKKTLSEGCNRISLLR